MHKTPKENTQNYSIVYQNIDNTQINDYDNIQQDCTNISNTCYRLTVYKNDSNSFFQVERLEDNKWHLIMRDPTYSTNNSSLYFADQNKDGLSDIVWNKKWQDHAYLFNPKIQNFIEVGEFHDVKTLQINGQNVLYKNAYPIYYFWNEEKSYETICGEIVENHSELFIIDKNYKKISFATLDNFDTFNHALQGDCEQIVKCYIPPYQGRYGAISIWNKGLVSDSIRLKIPVQDATEDNIVSLDSNWITNFWISNFSKYLDHGQVFRLRRTKPILYFK